MKSLFTFFIILISFELTELNAQNNKSSFVYQYFPFEKNDTSNNVQNLVENLIIIKYRGYFNGDYIRVDQIRESLQHGIRFRNDKAHSIYVDCKTDSIYVTEEDSLVSFKLLEATLTKTNEKKMIDKYQCIKYLYKDFELWFSDEVPEFVNLGIATSVKEKGLVAIVNKYFGEIKLIEFETLYSDLITLPKLPKALRPDAKNPLLEAASN